MNHLPLAALLAMAIGYMTFDNAIAQVTVEVNQQHYVFTNQPRLVEVLAPLATQQNWYWPAAALYEIDKIELEKTRQKVLNQLSILAKAQLPKNGPLKLAVEQLAADITNWTLARRLPIAIDYDLARIKAAANPKFTHGNYILHLARRSNRIHLLGAVNYSQHVAHLPHGDVSNYMAKQSLTNLADKDYVIVIQANGTVVKAPTAYWNKTHQEVMPGSQLFVPFKESLFTPELSKINQHIVKLALNRVL
ncbi:MAG: hypothetical protein ACI96W_002030 [Paraglaciecola sp.]|jgi:hypothetical protein